MDINYHTADCGSLPADRNLKLDYSSTLEGSVLTLTCENEMFNMNIIGSDAEVPDPADFIQSCLLFSTTVSPTTGTNYFSIIIKDILYTFKISFIVCLLI